MDTNIFDEYPGPGTTFHAPLAHSIPKLNSLTEARHCTRCGRKFGFLRTKYHCRNCGYVCCGRCSENRVELAKFGYFSPVRVCDLCFHYLNISKLARSQLATLPSKTLRDYIKAFNLPTNNIIEKDDLVAVIISQRPLGDQQEIYYREHIPIAEPATSADSASSAEEHSENNSWSRAQQSSSRGRRTQSRRANSPTSGPNGSSARRTASASAGARAAYPPRRPSNYSHNQQRQPSSQSQSSASSFVLPPMFENVFDFFGQLSSSQSSSSSSSSRDSSPSPGHSGFPFSTFDVPLFFPSTSRSSSTTTYSTFYSTPMTNDSNAPRTEDYIPSSNTRRSQEYGRSRTVRTQSTTRTTTQASSHPSAAFAANRTQQTRPTQSNRQTPHKRTDDGPPSIYTIIKNKIEVKKLSPKALKDILKDNGVDYTGLVEKSELVQKVERLIENAKKEMATDVDKLSDDSLCKICCDAPQNCVILDCGHMSTCMDCGKKLQESRNECPICRETIVKLLRVFRS